MDYAYSVIECQHCKKCFRYDLIEKHYLKCKKPKEVDSEKERLMKEYNQANQ